GCPGVDDQRRPCGQDHSGVVSEANAAERLSRLSSIRDLFHRGPKAPQTKRAIEAGLTIDRGLRNCSNSSHLLDAVTDESQLSVGLEYIG
ncbi:MAG: hypothetical protein AAF683_10090, partial [Pseudomonadota bacterium]